MADPSISSLLNQQNSPSGGAPPKKDEPRFLSFENVIDRKNKESEEERAAGIRLLRTYQDDLAEAVKGGEGQSLLSIALAENRRKEEERRKLTENPKPTQEKETVPARPSPVREALGENMPKRLEEAGISKASTTPTPSTAKPSAPASALHQAPPTIPVPPSTYLGNLDKEAEPKHILRWLILGTLLLLLLGTGTIGFVLYRGRILAPTTPILTAPLLLSSYQEKIVLKDPSSNPFLKEVERVKKDPRFALGTIVAVVPVTTKVDGQKEKEELIDTYTLLTNLLNTRASPALLRSFDPDFTFAFYERPLGAEGFLILTSNYYESSYAEMLQWEPFMRADIKNILLEEKAPSVSTPAAVGNASASSTGVFTEPPDKFEDMVLKNRDVRVLKDKTGTVILIYGFLNRKTLIIARSIETFNEVVGRLTANVRAK